MEYLEFLYFRLTNVFYLTYRALNVLSEECNLIQSELYRNPKSVLKRNDGVLYYDCTNYYFEIEQEDGDKKYGKVKNTVQTDGTLYRRRWNPTGFQHISRKSK